MAADILRACLFLHSEAIPEELIVNGASELGPVLQPVAVDPFLLDATIAILRRFSLVHRNSGTDTLSVHPLVQAVLQPASVKVLRGWQEGREYPVIKPETLLGREEHADIALFRDMQVQKRHALIRRDRMRSRIEGKLAATS